MKTIVALTLAVCVFLPLTSGCDTPAYTSQERGQLILRNWYYEYQQIQDDVDSLFLLRPATQLTIWNVR